MKTLANNEENLKGFYARRWYEWKLQDYIREYDTLVLIPEHKTVLNIEVKNGDKMNLLKEAAGQCRNHRDFFATFFGTIIPDWSFVSVACVTGFQLDTDNAKEQIKMPCTHCQDFIIGKG